MREAVSRALAHSLSTSNQYYQAPTLRDTYMTYEAIDEIIREKRARSPSPKEKEDTDSDQQTEVKRKKEKGKEKSKVMAQNTDRHERQLYGGRECMY